MLEGTEPPQLLLSLEMHDSKEAFIEISDLTLLPVLLIVTSLILLSLYEMKWAQQHYLGSLALFCGFC